MTARSGALTTAGHLIGHVTHVISLNLFQRRSRLLLLALLGVAVAVWSGYRAERRTRDAAGAPEISVQRMVKRLVTPAAKRAGTDRLEELRQAIGRKFPSSRETAALWSVVRGFSVEEVKMALGTLPKESDLRVNGEIASMLYYRWAQLDPETAAAAALASREIGYLSFSAVVAAWSQVDPEAAIRWGRDSGSDLARNSVRWLAARKWLNDDPATAVSRARAEFPEAVPNVLRHLVTMLTDGPESRPQVLAILAEEIPEEERSRYLSSLAYRTGPLDPARVEEIAGDMAAAGWSDHSIQEFHEVLQRFFPVQGTPPVLERADPGTGREDRESAYRRWVIARPEEALAWAESRGEPGLISQAVNEFADNLLASNWSPGREGHGRTVDLVRNQFAVWQRLDAPAAETWLATMPADLRNQVTTATPEDDATR